MMPSMNTLPSSAPPLPTDPSQAPAVRWSRAVAVGSLLGLIVLGLAWELVLAPTGNRSLALKVLPLALPLAGLLKNRMYTYRWLSLVIWLYFIEGVIRATSDRGLSAGLALIEVVLCLSLFVACAVHVRWRLANPGPQAIDATPDAADKAGTVPNSAPP